MITAYPLTWPDKPRTVRRLTYSVKYKQTFSEIRDNLIGELGKISAYKIVISSNVPLLKNGLPKGSYKEPDDPGICVYFSIRRQNSVQCFAICCDAWNKVKDNLREIYKYLSSLNTIQTSKVCGASVADILLNKHLLITEDYTAPPPKSKPTQKAPWMAILNLTQEEAQDYQKVRKAYLHLAKIYHPDNGTKPNKSKMQQVNLAHEQAKKVLGR